MSRSLHGTFCKGKPQKAQLRSDRWITRLPKEKNSQGTKRKMTVTILIKHRGNSRRKHEHRALTPGTLRASLWASCLSGADHSRVPPQNALRRYGSIAYSGKVGNSKGSSSPLSALRKASKSAFSCVVNPKGLRSGLRFGSSPPPLSRKSMTSSSV